MFTDLIKYTPLYDMVEEYIWEKVDTLVGDSPEVIAAILEGRCYRALCKIQTFVQDDSLDDFQCMEHIVEVFCQYGLKHGARHGFG